MVVNAVMLIAWNVTDANAFVLTISVFGILYIASGYLLQSRSEKPLIWASLVAAASIGYYFLGYYKIQNTELVSSISLFWGILALAFAGFSTYALQNILKEVEESHPQKQHLMAIYSGMGTAFLSIALSIELPREFLSVAFAAQFFAITWINTKINVKALRCIAAILACVFGFLLIPQFLLLVQLTVYSLIEARLVLQNSVPIVNWPIFQLGLPALFFVIGSYLLRKQKDDKLVNFLETAAIALVGIMGYYLTHHAFHIDEDILFVKAGFIECSVITNILFIYGLVCLWIGRYFTRRAVSLSGLVLSGIAIFRVCYFDCIIYNPLWSSQAIGTLPIFNALLFTYGLPILWTLRTIFELPHIGKTEWSKYGYSFILFLSFMLISLNVRQIFHGTYLNGHEISNAEIYAYFIAWLLFCLALLFIGVLRKDKIIRIASLIVILLTVGKVFLYDASALTELFRVFSFFGLGISLLSLSWLYTKFVFGKCDYLENFRKSEK